MVAALNDKAAITVATIGLNNIICLAVLEKIRAIAAGKTKRAVIKNTPTMRADKAIATESKIKKDKFHSSILTPSICAKS